jgi:hypothetical protein
MALLRVAEGSAPHVGNKNDATQEIVVKKRARVTQLFSTLVFKLCVSVRTNTHPYNFACAIFAASTQQSNIITHVSPLPTSPHILHDNPHTFCITSPLSYTFCITSPLS